MKRIEPTRRLTCGSKPHKYIDAAHTNVARTLRKFRLLARLQALKENKQ